MSGLKKTKQKHFHITECQLNGPLNLQLYNENLNQTKINNVSCQKCYENYKISEPSYES